MGPGPGQDFFDGWDLDPFLDYVVFGASIL